MVKAELTFDLGVQRLMHRYDVKFGAVTVNPEYRGNVTEGNFACFFIPKGFIYTCPQQHADKTK